MPWRERPSPYGTWVSEIMLQQTQVSTVEPYYERFLRRFPDIASLAKAPEREVLRLWAGLGYYSRARNLLAAARELMRRHAGRLPSDPALLRALPGIGRYTAGAIASIAFDRPEALVDGNVERVLSRLFASRGDVWPLARKLLHKGRPGDWNQALMELGALVCKPVSPLCAECPVREHCLAFKRGVQESFPKSRKRRAPVDVRLTALLARRGGRLLLWKRSERERFLPGHWSLPERRHLPGAAPGALLGTVRHSITHHRIVLSLQEGLLRGSRRPAQARWVSEKRVDRYLVSSLWKKAVRTALCAALLLPACARARDSSAMSAELRQMLAMQRTPSMGPLLIRKLKSRYPVWAVRARDTESLLRQVGSAVLYIDLSSGPVRVEGRDVRDAIRLRMGKAAVGGACYQVAQLADIADRYGPGGAPESERAFLDTLRTLGAAGPDTVILLTPATTPEELDHELMHALFYSEPGFRDAVSRIWDSLGQAERDFVQKSLGATYGLGRRELLLQEFAAYAAAGFPRPVFRVPALLSGLMKQAAERIRRERDVFLPSNSPDYDDPYRYLEPGPQSRLSRSQAKEVLREIGPGGWTRDMAALAQAHSWMTRGFSTEALGGATVGKAEAKRLLKSRLLSGCHDWALVLGAVLRELGMPAIMVDTASLKWMADPGTDGQFFGHVFLEVFVGGRWILLDPGSGRYLADYSPDEPVIPLPAGPEDKGYFILRKGRDPKEYGVTSVQALNELMLDASKRLPSMKLSVPKAEVSELPEPR